MADIRDMSDSELKQRYAEVAAKQDRGEGLSDYGRRILEEAGRRGAAWL